MPFLALRRVSILGMESCGAAAWAIRRCGFMLVSSSGCLGGGDRLGSFNFLFRLSMHSTPLASCSRKMGGNLLQSRRR